MEHLTTAVPHVPCLCLHLPWRPCVTPMHDPAAWDPPRVEMTWPVLISVSDPVAARGRSILPVYMAPTPARMEGIFAPRLYAGKVGSPMATTHGGAQCHSNAPPFRPTLAAFVAMQASGRSIQGALNRQHRCGSASRGFRFQRPGQTTMRPAPLAAQTCGLPAPGARPRSGRGPSHPTLALECKVECATAEVGPRPH